MDWFPVTSKTFVVLGLARSGLSTINWLRGQGAHVLAFDDSPEKREMAHQMGVSILDDFEIFKSKGRICAVVQSPGVPFSYPHPHPVTTAAIAEGIPIISDIDLFKQAHTKNRLIGVTGTNGKSTTSALVGHILKHCKIQVSLGGNIGIPVLSLPELSEEGCYVLELSSYQLDLVNDLDLDTAIWLNISEDHLDRHGSMEQYILAKRQIFSGKNQRQSIIIGIDDLPSLTTYRDLKKDERVQIVPVSINQELSGGVYLRGSVLIDDYSRPKAETILDCRDLPTLLGRHNWQNAAIAYAFARSWGCSVVSIIEALKTFPGLPHRQEHIITIQQVSFINDSKATNAESTAKALDVFDEIYWIAGGQPKQDGIGALAPFFPKIKQAFLIGQAQDLFAKTLEGTVPYTLCQDLEEATGRAFKEAKANNSEKSIVLLSPACASFDQFRDFEHRGDMFRAAAFSLNSQISKA